MQTPDSSSFQPESLESRKPLVHHDSLSMQRQLEMDANEAAQLEEREREMRQLETDILDINDIFRDLGTMVHDQGELVGKCRSLS
jgi:t-SNARE complex subunit (syntaxin)